MPTATATAAKSRIRRAAFIPSLAACQPHRVARIAVEALLGRDARGGVGVALEVVLHVVAGEEEDRVGVALVVGDAVHVKKGRVARRVPGDGLGELVGVAAADEGDAPALAPGGDVELQLLGLLADVDHPPALGNEGEVAERLAHDGDGVPLVDRTLEERLRVRRLARARGERGYERRHESARHEAKRHAWMKRPAPHHERKR